MLILASRGRRRATAGGRGSACRFCCAVLHFCCVCCCRTACQWCGCVRTSRDALSQLCTQSAQFIGDLASLAWTRWPPSHSPPHARTLKVPGLAPTVPQLPLSTCPPASAQRCPEGLLPAFWVTAGLGKPANLSPTKWAATTPSPERFEPSLGVGCPLPSLPFFAMPHQPYSSFCIFIATLLT